MFSKTFSDVVFVHAFMQIYAWCTHNAAPEGTTAARNTSYANLCTRKWWDANLVYLGWPLVPSVSELLSQIFHSIQSQFLLNKNLFKQYFFQNILP